MSYNPDEKQSLRDRILRSMFAATVEQHKNPHDVRFKLTTIADDLQLPLDEVAVEVGRLVSSEYVDERVKFDSGDGLYSLRYEGMERVEEMIRGAKAELEHRILDWIYESTVKQGKEISSFQIGAVDVAKQFEVTEQDAGSAIVSLHSRDFLEVADENWQGKSYRLSTKAVRSIEGKIRGLDPASPHHLIVNQANYNFGTMYNQVGETNTLTVNQNVNDNLVEILQLLMMIRQQAEGLPSEQRDIIMEDLESLESEVKADERNPKSIRKMFRHLVTDAKDITSLLATLVSLGEKLGIT